MLRLRLSLIDTSHMWIYLWEDTCHKMIFAHVLHPPPKKNKVEVGVHCPPDQDGPLAFHLMNLWDLQRPCWKPPHDDK